MFRIATVIIFISIGLAVPEADAAQRNYRQHKSVTVKVLPKGHRQITHRGKSYFYSGGRFYRSGSGSYVSIVAPLGAIVPTLPGGYISFGIGSRRHFYFEGIYYRQVSGGYEVVEEPAEAEQVMAKGSDKLIVYPAAGQTEEQRDRDQYECHQWAVDETRFDPTDTDSDVLLQTDYNRAIEACMVARDYVVN